MAEEVLTTDASKVAGGLSPAELVDVQGVLVISTLFQTRLGMPMDQDRMDCIRRLREFAKGCWIRTGTDKETGEARYMFHMEQFRCSYSFCVPANEFPDGLWTKICWAYYFHFIMGKKEIRDKKTEELVPVFHFIKLMDFAIEDPMTDREKRMKRDLEIARTLNAEFNANFAASRNDVQMLFDDVFMKAEEKASKARKKILAYVYGSIVGINAQDRRITIQTDLVIHGEGDRNIARMWQFREILSEAMQEVIGDSCCQVVCMSANSQMNRGDLYRFSISKREAEEMGALLPKGR